MKKRAKRLQGREKREKGEVLTSIERARMHIKLPPKPIELTSLYEIVIPHDTLVRRLTPDESLGSGSLMEESNAR